MQKMQFTKEVENKINALFVVLIAIILLLFWFIIIPVG
jgi:hypothetical protein